MVRADDLALYRAKERGRNCVVLAENDRSTISTAENGFPTTPILGKTETWKKCRIIQPVRVGESQEYTPF